MRTVISPGSYAANSVITEPLASIANLDLWAYFNNVNPAKNIITNDNLSVFGAPTQSYAYHTITGGTNYYTLQNFIDVPTQTLLFAAKFTDSGGNFAPIFTAYPGASGLFIGLGNNYLRIHASGFGAIANFAFPAIVGNVWSFYSVILESGAALPIRVKNWSYNMEATGGTALASRTTLGGSLTLGQHSIAVTGIFPAQVTFAGRARSVMSDAQILSCKSTVEANISPLGIAVL